MMTRITAIRRRRLLSLAYCLLVACDSNQTAMQGSTNLQTSQPKADNVGAQDNNLLSQGALYSFKLRVADGQSYVRVGTTQATTEVHRDEAAEALDGSSAADWQVRLSVDTVQGAALPLGEQPLDLSAKEGAITVTADFVHKNGQTGRASQNIFVDGTPPQLSLLELQTSPDGEKRQLYWSAVDNFTVNSKRTTLYACLESQPQFLIQSLDELKNLTASCAIVARGSELIAKGEQITVGSSSIGNQEYQPAQLVHYLFAEDLVGFTRSIEMSPAATTLASLSLKSLLPAPFYTNQTEFDLPLSLTHLERGQLTQVHSMDKLWPRYSLAIKGPTDSLPQVQDFLASPRLKLGSSDGVYGYSLYAQLNGTDVQSNNQNVAVILDRTAPQVSAVQIVIPDSLLSPSSQVTVSWVAADANGIKDQTLEIQLRGSSERIKIADLNGTLSSTTFTWGSRPTQGFTAYVTARDQAGNVGSAQTSWVPQIFNAAVLTSSVECFYCHMRIEGDVGGINFPPNAVMDQRGDTGDQFFIQGRLFATNAIPDLFKRQIAAKNMAVSDGLVDFYDNAGVKIFPSQKDASGVPVFPTLDVNNLRQRMNGTVVDKDGKRYSRIYEGNLILRGTEANPIRLNGEVLITGDLVIAGYYQGIGSLYANNVYVPNNLRSVECKPGSTSCPYPFKGASDAEKLASARDAISKKRSALYLAGLKQTVVGGISTAWGGGFDLTNPYSWFPEADFRQLCSQAVFIKTASGANYVPRESYISPSNSSDIRSRCEVNQVDAFLYGRERIAWRSYANFLINGGFVGYKAALLATLPYRIHQYKDLNPMPLNPANGLPADQSIIRYDWRLRAGGPGFESLKALFDQ